MDTIYFTLKEEWSPNESRRDLDIQAVKMRDKMIKRICT